MISLDLKVVSEYKYPFEKMIIQMGVQVLGAIINKCVSTADNKWGYK